MAATVPAGAAAGAAVNGAGVAATVVVVGAAGTDAACAAGALDGYEYEYGWDVAPGCVGAVASCCCECCCCWYDALGA